MQTTQSVTVGSASDDSWSSFEDYNDNFPPLSRKRGKKTDPLRLYARTPGMSPVSKLKKTLTDGASKRLTGIKALRSRGQVTSLKILSQPINQGEDMLLRHYLPN